jgi:hypothetical protein
MRNYYSNTLKIPSYYSPDLPYTCINPVQQGNNLEQILTEASLDNLFDNQTTNIQNGIIPLLPNHRQEDLNPKPMQNRNWDMLKSTILFQKVLVGQIINPTWHT